MTHRRARQLWRLAGALLVLVAAAPLVWQYAVVVPSDQRFVDLDVYRAAGESLWRGRLVYDHLTDPPQLLPFTYPPLAAILLGLALAAVPWTALGWAWTVSQVVLLGFACRLALRPVLARAGMRAPLIAGAFTAAALWLLPVRDGLKFGQVDVLLLALVTADLLFPRPRWRRGVLIGIATAVKLTPGIFVVALWVAGRRRAATTAVATAVALTGLAALAVPEASLAFWTSAVFAPDRLGLNGGTSNQGLRGMLLRAPLSDSATTLGWLVAVAVVAGIGLRRVARVRDPLEIGALGGLLAVLLSPVAWIHHLTWMVLPLAVLVRDRRHVLAGLVAGVLALPVPWWGAIAIAKHTWPRPLALVVQDAFGLLTLALLVLLPIARPIGRAIRAGPTRPAAERERASVGRE